MKREDVFPSKYLKASDLNGAPRVVVIASAPYETLKRPMEKRVWPIPTKARLLLPPGTNKLGTAGTLHYPLQVRSKHLLGLIGKVATERPNIIRTLPQLKNVTFICNAADVADVAQLALTGLAHQPAA